MQTKAASDRYAETIAGAEEARGRTRHALTKVDTLQTALDKAENEKLNLTKRLWTRRTISPARWRNSSPSIANSYDKLNKSSEIILDRPDGFVTYVDYETKEILVSNNRP